MAKLLLFFFAIFFFAPTLEYRFDRKLVYVVSDFKTRRKPRSISYFINEHNNDYFVFETFVKKNEYQLIDRNGLAWKGRLTKEDLQKSEIILPNELTGFYSNPYKYQINNYDFSPMKDTVLNDKAYKRFKLHCTDPERVKNKKLGTEIYVVDTSEDVKPLFTYETAFEIWKARNNFPNGIIVEKYFYDFKNKLARVEKLKSSEAIKLTLFLPPVRENLEEYKYSIVR